MHRNAKALSNMYYDPQYTAQEDRGRKAAEEECTSSASLSSISVQTLSRDRCVLGTKQACASTRSSQKEEFDQKWVIDYSSISGCQV